MESVVVISHAQRAATLLSSVISAAKPRSHCSLAMLNCPWMAQPHAAFQLAHSDSEGRGQEKKRGDKVGESGHHGDRAWEETGKLGSLKWTIIAWSKTATTQRLAYFGRSRTRIIYVFFFSVPERKWSRTIKTTAISIIITFVLVYLNPFLC